MLFRSTPSGWDCKATSVAAPQFSEERRTQATIAASSHSLFFDVDQTASPIEKQLLEQVKAQTTKTPIAQVNGKVPGFDCLLTLDSPLTVDGISTPLTLKTSINVDADTTVQIWRVALVEPKVDDSISTDFTVMAKARRHVVRPAIMTAPVRAGAESSVSVGISNKGEDIAEHPAVLMAMPSRTMVTNSRSIPKGWNCVQIAPGLASGLVVCSGNKLAPGESSDAAVFDFKAFVDREKSSNISAVALTNGRKVGLTSATTAEIGVKAPIKIQVTGPDSVNDISIPLSGGDPTNTTVYVSAQSSTEGLRYEWKQLCTVPGEQNCPSTAPAVKFAKSFGPSAEVIMPRVAAAADIVLQVTGYDGSAKASATHIIRVEPKPTIQAPPKADPNDPVGYEAAGQSLRPRAFEPSAAATTLVAATPTTVLVIAPLPPADSQWKCERFLSASPFRYTSRGCTTFAAGGLLTAATVSTNDVLVAQLRNNPRASWAVESDQSWASPSVSGSGETSRIKLSFANTDLQAARSAKIRLYLIPVEGTRQELGSFTVTQYPAEEIGRAHV